ncbi:MULTISPECIES: bifunctional hydroxymethylpyrimidine kinase/phosphomethylpyrimidine kinase [Thiorhodovibrio]|uniref:bifunctional hydroxymethylpyrimidine kinase/phosphomethylpyrimidine kinase n=1 Tax=Thiorhodovibrio TaxID=61593 RepID=UPI001F5D4D33|nr:MULTISPECIES: hydroxymethylpyrimidine/phosphomethylpyrimidine kinase [Thiorhodovibrio]
MKPILQAPSEPVLLAIGGHDPGGGAGLQADIEAAAALGLHCCTAISCITVQTSCRLTQTIAQPVEQLRDQCLAVFEDCQVAAVKIGLIGHSHLVQTIATLLEAHPDLPVVFDPVLATGSGERIADAALLNQLRRHLVKRCTLVTPNLPEAKLLADAPDRDQAAQRLLAMGARAVLITGTHDDSAQVINTFYPAGKEHSQMQWPRLPGSFHGSGCTLASAIAARLALGMELDTAVREAQHYTMATLRQARALARCQQIPRRLLVADQTSERPNALRTLVAPAPTKPDNGHLPD